MNAATCEQDAAGHSSEDSENLQIDGILRLSRGHPLEQIPVRDATRTSVRTIASDINHD